MPELRARIAYEYGNFFLWKAEQFQVKRLKQLSGIDNEYTVPRTPYKSSTIPNQ
jgi:hypothetical protein